MSYAELSDLATTDIVLEAYIDQIRQNFDAMCAGFVPGGRLTGTTGSPAGDSGSTANLYYSPYLHNGVKLYDGANWVFYQFSEITLSLSGLTTGTNYDIFLYSNSGTLTLEATAWTDGTTRATALVRQDGVWLKNGSLTRLYLGTIRTSATGQTIDSNGFRFIWNMYNRLAKEVIRTDSTDNWTYATNTWRSWNNNSANSIGMVRGLDEDNVDVTFTAILSGGNGIVGLQIGSAGGDGIVPHTNDTSIESITTRFDDLAGIGYRVLFLSERALSGTTTFYGDGASVLLAGARGHVWC